MMFKKMILITSVLLFIFSGNVFAHSQLSQQLKTEVVAQGDTTKDKTVVSLDSEATIKEQASSIQKSESSSPTIIHYIIPGLIIFVMVVGFGSYWLLFRRNHV